MPAAFSCIKRNFSEDGIDSVIGCKKIAIGSLLFKKKSSYINKSLANV